MMACLRLNQSPLFKRIKYKVDVFDEVYILFNFNDMLHLLTAIGLTPGGSSTVHIYTQTIQRTTQLTTLVERLSGI